MRDVKPPLYGPTSGTWVQSAGVVIRPPPRPPSATYRSPPGPNASPRGLFKPVANTVMFADNGEAAAGEAAAGEAAAGEAAAGEAAAGEAASGTAAASSADSPARRTPRDSLIKDQVGKCIAIAPFLARSLCRPGSPGTKSPTDAGPSQRSPRVRRVRNVCQAAAADAAQMPGLSRLLNNPALATNVIKRLMAGSPAVNLPRLQRDRRIYAPGQARSIRHRQCRSIQAKPVDAENCATLCDLGVFVNQPAESVASDFTDEPASVLLERISAERAPVNDHKMKRSRRSPVVGNGGSRHERQCDHRPEAMKLLQGPS